jgi:hypothetical protein
MTTTGDILYASAANTPARLGIGSSGQVLTVASGIPSWAAAGGGGMTLAGSPTSLSGNTVVITLPSSSSGYLRLFIHIDSWSMSGGNGYHTCRFNSDSSSNYRYAYQAAYGHALDNTSGSVGASSFPLPYISNMKNGAVGNMWMKIENPNGSGAKFIQATATGNEGISGDPAAIYSIDGTYAGSALTTVTFANDSGGKSYSSGTVYVYGVK